MFLITIAIQTLALMIVNINASSLPSNALNRWNNHINNKNPLSILVRGGETLAVRTVSTKSSSKPRLLIDDPTSTTSSSKTKKKRKRKSSSSSSAPSSSGKSISSSGRYHGTTSTKARQDHSSASAAISSSTGTTQAAAATTSATSQSQVSPSSSSTSQQGLSSPTTTSPESTSTSTSLLSSSSSSSSSSTITPAHDQMPSIFQPEESIYDKYAACLAATEGLRRMRDSKILKNKRFRTAVNVDAERSSGWKSLLKGDSSTSSSGSTEAKGPSLTKRERELLSVEQQKEEYKRSCAEYVLNSSKVIKALGLSVSQFNQLGREVRKNKPLKERVSSPICYRCRNECFL